jgi:hypothetical protein
MSIKEGGPAFPSPLHHEGEPGHESEVFAPGMSLRDWFAGHALAGLLARDFGRTDEEEGVTEIAQKAYDLADAMIADREALS